MVVHKIDIEGFAVLEAENNSPVGAHGYGPKAIEVAGKRRKPEGRNVDVGNFLCGIHHGQNLPDLANVLRIHPFRVVILKKLSQPLLPVDQNESCVK